MTESIGLVGSWHTYNIGSLILLRASQDADLRYNAHRTWPRQGACDPQSLGTVLYYNRVANELSVVVDAGGLIYDIHTRSHQLAVTATGSTPEAVETALDTVQALWPNDIVATTEQEIPVKFWFNSARGPQSWTRNISVPTWGEIADNYPKADDVRSIAQWSNPPESASGKLMLWFGKPGVGKTYAVRCLGWEWRDWCSLEYITDPDAFFGDASYMMQALIEGMSEEEYPVPSKSSHYRLLICEDVGELMVADAKQRTGQALSRLLNLSEGLIGQGMKLMVLLTTNEELTSLHPAVRRPGRSLVNLDFPPFTHDAAVRWLGTRGEQLPVMTTPPTLADLYAVTNHHNVEQKVKQLSTVGFR